MSVLVCIEPNHRLSLETITAARELASGSGLPLFGAVIGDQKAGGLEKLYTLDHPSLARYTADGYAAAYEQLIRSVNPTYVLLPHTYTTRDFAPKLATRFDRVLVSDVTGIQGTTIVRQLFQGKLNADIEFSGEPPYFASVQAGAFQPDQQSGESPSETFSVEPGVIRTDPGEPFRDSQRAVDLSSAGLIVSVGRGIKEQENLKLVEELATALGAELAASRPICDSGWLPMERQVGSSGQTVSPKLYIAIGISGAIQHLVGMKSAKTIVAINKDPEAPIFEVADYGIIGDLFEVVPALIEEIRKARG
ncbi:MAG TPA: electron transfer flavoprotein subunit alpha/FixB family protein [Bryobacteraceae bacterium]|nr:electron transfer flavoprotein subunit alpha/FixB family protein [Bryobacteraceae bacterium]